MLPEFLAKKSLRGSQYVSKRRISGANSSADAIIPMQDCYIMCYLGYPGFEGADFCRLVCHCGEEP